MTESHNIKNELALPIKRIYVSKEFQKFSRVCDKKKEKKIDT